LKGTLKFTQRENAILLIANVVGVVVFLWLGSWTWMPAEERRLGIHSVTGEPLIWALSALPVLAVFIVLNLSWAAFILGRRQWKSGRPWFLAMMIWLVALAIDVVHR
jgi:TRAP-type C4-dicarboxylate transport system permease small subunit